jgi:hypothetical protein
MGGEFFLTFKPRTEIVQEFWMVVLKEITKDIEEQYAFTRDREKYAFEYVDPVYSWKFF